MSARPPLPPTHPADTSTLEAGTDMQSVPENPLTQSAFICGEVSYRTGDGPMVVIRPGPVSVEVGTHDVTLGWEEDASRLSAVMPRTEYARFIGEGAIKPLVTHSPEATESAGNESH